MRLVDRPVVDRADSHLFPSTISFILCAIGFAIGLGNLWRFPIYVYRYGGGTFFIPYLFGLIALGVPLLTLETGIGNASQKGPIGAFGHINRRFSGIGAAAVYNAFVVCTYYSSILAWGLVYLVESFYNDLPWDVDIVEGETYNITLLDKPNDYFYDSVLMASEDPGSTKVISSALFGALFAMWVFSYLAVFNGPKTTGYITYITVSAPIVMLAILLIRGSTLEGAGDGITDYIGTWDFSELKNGQMWIDAISQIFFSLGVAVASLISFGSYTPRGFSVVKNSVIVAVGNSTFSFFAGFAVFEILGWFSNLTGVPIEDVTQSGPSLAFIVYPTALSQLPAPQLFNVLFFLTIFFLGIDTLFGTMEGVTGGIDDTKYMPYLKDVPKIKIGIVYALAWLLSIWYVSDVGLYLLDVVDHYLASYCLLVVGGMEAVTVSWIHLHDTMMDMLGRKCIITFEVTYLGCILVGVVISIALNGPVDGQLAALIGFVCGFVVFIVGTLFAVVAGHKFSGLDMSTVLDRLFNFQADDIRCWINNTVTQNSTNGNLQIPRVWNFFIKFVIPATIIILIIENIYLSVEIGPYGGYPTFYQVVGGLVLIGAIGIMILGAVFPSILDGPEINANGEKGVEDSSELPEPIVCESQVSETITSEFGVNEKYGQDAV
eukprot:Clim_evm3s22 gene=Clim_evmTU3s22